MTKKDEEKICRDFVKHLNATNHNDSLTYSGHIEDIYGKNFPDCEIYDSDSRTAIKVEITEIFFDWDKQENENFEKIRVRTCKLLEKEQCKNYKITLLPKLFNGHLIANINKKEIDCLSLQIKKFIDRECSEINTTNIKTVQKPILHTFSNNDWPLLSKYFYNIRIEYHESDNWKLNPNTPAIHLHSQGFTGKEIANKIIDTLTKKNDKTTDYLLFYNRSHIFIPDQDWLIFIQEKSKQIGLQNRYKQFWLLNSTSINQQKEQLIKIF